MDITANSMNTHQGRFCKFLCRIGLHTHDKSGKKAAAALAAEAKDIHDSRSSGSKHYSHTKVSIKGGHDLSEVAAGGLHQAVHNFGQASIVDHSRKGQFVESLAVPVPASAEVHGMGRRHSTGPLPKGQVLSDIKAITVLSGPSDTPMSSGSALEGRASNLSAAQNEKLSGSNRAGFLHRSRDWSEHAVALGGLQAPEKLSEALDVGVLDRKAGGWVAISKTSDANFWKSVQANLDKQVGEVAITDLKEHYSKLKVVTAEDRMVAFVRISHEVHKLEETTTHWSYWLTHLKSIKASEGQNGNLAGNIWDVYDIAMKQYS